MLNLEKKNVSRYKSKIILQMDKVKKKSYIYNGKYILVRTILSGQWTTRLECMGL